MLNLFKKGGGSNRKEQDFYDKTQRNSHANRRDLEQPTKKNTKTKATPEWSYKLPAILIAIAFVAIVLVLGQYIGKTWHEISTGTKGEVGLFTVYRFSSLYLILLIVAPGVWWYANHQLRAIWMNNNAMFLSEDIEEYANDAYVQTPVHIIRNFDSAPDAGLGFNGHVSSLVGHMMIDNKGIKKIDMPQLDPDVPGQVKRDAKGNVVTKKMEMFDKKFGIELFAFSNVSAEHQKWYNATEYDFNPKTSRKDQRAGIKRQGSFGQKEHDKLSDYINNEFYPIDTDTQRPAGVYFYDSRPVNTILIAITRGNNAQLVG